MARLGKRLAPIGVLALVAIPVRAQSSIPAGPLHAVEATFDSLRYLRDQLDVTRSLGADRSRHGVAVETLVRDYQAARAELAARLERLDHRNLRRADSLALAAMRDVFQSSLGPDRGRPGVGVTRAGICQSEQAESTLDVDSLEAAIFACYSPATKAIVVGNDTLDRLSILQLLGTTPDRADRERLFRSLDRVWSVVNGHDEPTSPYRRLVELRRTQWDRIGPGHTPMDARTAGLGLTSARVERWLEQALDGFRATLPDTIFEPWDFYYYTGALDRRFSDRIPVDSLLTINRRFYRSLGADPVELNIQYDLEPRAGKYPIAFTTFGARGVERAGHWIRGEPWVFASYRIGGLGNLTELLHETGHGIHLAAIRSRPAHHDWPDSDTFTEGIADLAWFELYEPAWQRRFLGDAAPLAESIRAKYASVMLDMAWALFEYRVHRAGALSPNQVWADITSRYFKIRAHPELSWWAMRGQLIESPGYMLNYALGSFLVADARQALIARIGGFTTGRADWYRKTAPLVYRFGDEVPARVVLERLIGRPIRPDALLRDLERARGGR